MSEFAIAFDVGGTFVKSAVLNAAGEIVRETMEIFPSHSKGSKEDILSHFVAMIGRQAAKIAAPDARFTGIGYAFPGPFDYENGICRIQDADKYEAIYNVNLRAEIARRLYDSPLRHRLADGFAIVFENDAGLFALGEWLAGKASRFGRCICLTIGTGAGSAFLERGELVKNISGVPANGWVYSEPFDDSVVDEHISRRGILRLARTFGFDPRLDVKELAEEAYRGNAAAGEVFTLFGTKVGQMLLPYVRSFRADGVVIGGQIAKSHSLFDPPLRRILSAAGVEVEYSADTSISTFAGVHSLLRQQRRKRERGEAT